MDAHRPGYTRPHSEKKVVLLTIGEAAEYLRFHPSTVYRLARRGELPAVKVGKQWRLDRETLEGWLRANSAVTGNSGPSIEAPSG